jgi:GTP-binding protein
VAIPRVTIVGRPNVGKSSLFNRLVGRRVSIVEPTAGVTRDRVTATVRHADRTFEVVDTGGLGLVDEALLKEHVEAQIEVALETADVILFVVDAKEGRVPGDDLVARRLRPLHEQAVLLIANKVESYQRRSRCPPGCSWDSASLWRPAPRKDLGASGLLTASSRSCPPKHFDEDAPEGDVLRFAVVGKRNSGKSTLINLLAGEERVIVSELPGTTRDAVDVVFDFDGRS